MTSEKTEIQKAFGEEFHYHHRILGKQVTGFGRVDLSVCLFVTNIIQKVMNGLQ